MPVITPYNLVAGKKPRPLILVINNHADGDPLDVSAAAGVTSITLTFRRAVCQTNLFDLTAAYVGDGTDGRVRFDWGEELVGLPEDRYEGEIQVHYSDYDAPLYRIIQFQLRPRFN